MSDQKATNAFVTGGSRGIGRAIVTRLAAAGYGVAFSYAGNEAAAQQTVEAAAEAGPGARVTAYRLDVRDAGAVEATIEQVIDEYGDVHVLVNNAGMVRDRPVALMSDEEWHDVINANLSGPFYTIRALILHFVSNRYGRIINISSLSARGISGQANYAAAKAGLEGLTKSVAKEYGRKGITCNVVTVGYVPTDMTEENMAGALQDYWLQHCPLGRVGKAEEIAGMVHYLTTEPGSFITGEVFTISGGLTYAP